MKNSKPGFAKIFEDFLLQRIEIEIHRVVLRRQNQNIKAAEV